MKPTAGDGCTQGFSTVRIAQAHGTCHVGGGSSDAVFLGSFESKEEDASKGVSDLAAKLIHTVRGKFKESGTEGLLNRVENNPTQKHIDTVQDELTTQTEEDESYAAHLQDLVAQLEAAGIVRQVMASGLGVEETLEAQSMTQTASSDTDVEQRILTDVKAKGFAPKATIMGSNPHDPNH